MGIKFNCNSVFPTLWDKAETSVFISAVNLTVCFKINHPPWIINTAFSVRFVIIKSLFVCFQWWLICFPFSCLVIQLWRKMKPSDNLQILVRTEQSVLKSSVFQNIQLKRYTDQRMFCSGVSFAQKEAWVTNYSSTGGCCGCTLKPRVTGIDHKTQFSWGPHKEGLG